MSKVVALDLGTKRVGVAVSDRSRTIAFPRPHLSRTGDSTRDLEALVTLVLDEGAEVVVVGMPIALDGSKGPSARVVGDEIEMLQGALEPHGVKVIGVDERFTTKEASAALREAGLDLRTQRSKIDSAAATILLEYWLALS